MKKVMKIASVAMAAVMLLSVVPCTASAATAKKVVSSANVAKGVKISWKKTNKAGKYKVYRSTSKKKGYKVIATTKKLSFIDKKAKAGKTYYYTVKTTNKTKSAYKTSKVVRLTAPTLKSVVAEESGNRVTLKWTKVKGAKSYGIYYATVKNGKTKKYQEFYSVNRTKETIVLDKAGTYKFKIVAKYGKSKSVFSNSKKLKFVETPDVVLSVGETDNTIVDAVEFIESFAEAFGVKIDVVASWKIADPAIISIGEDYVITGLAAGETTFDLTISYEIEGQKYSETSKLTVLVKKGETVETPDATTITEDEAIALVKKEMGEDFSYIPADELEERDGSQYYVIYVKKLLEQGNYTTMATYLVKTDGTEVFDKDAVSATITEEEAIALVKKEMGDEFHYVPADELEEKDGCKYYVIYVKKLLDAGNLTTVATYMVKVDGSEYFDKDAVSSYVGEYVNTGSVGETTFIVSEDGTFEMTTLGAVNQTVIGNYKFGITDSENVIKLLLYPSKSIVESEGEEVETPITDVEGTAIIENGTLTLSMESQDTVFTKK